LKKKVKNSKNSVLDLSLNNVAKGSFFVFIGISVGMLFGFIGRIMFARLYSPADYGIFSLGVSLITVLTVIGTLGFKDGVSRQISYYEKKGDKDKCNSIVFWSIILSIFVSVFISIILLFNVNVISEKIFSISGYSFQLKIFFIGIPFFTLIQILVSIFRGYHRVKEQIIFLDILKNLFFPLLLIIAFLFKLSNIWGFYSYVLSLVLTGVLFFVYFLKKKIISLPLNKAAIDFTCCRELIFFSFPLLVVSGLSVIMSNIDTLMLSIYKSADLVGVYNAAIPLTHIPSIFLNSVLFLFMPFISFFYANNNFNEIRKSYSVVTKWITSFSLPIILLLFFFPDVVINLFFGVQYLEGIIVLRIISIGTLFHIIMGPNGALLTGIGQTKFLMWTTVFSVVINIFLNIVLIPEFGMTGAAVATFSAIFTMNLLKSLKIFFSHKIHAFTINNLKPLLITLAFFFIVYFFIEKIYQWKIWMVVIFGIFLVGVSLFSIVISKSIDDEDVNLFNSFEKKFGFNFERIKKMINRWLK
jgi:O-antigen/teichoic acid export membrane protein